MGEAGYACGRDEAFGRLLSRLSEVLGEEEARTLIECLPPVRWEQLATKDDVRASEDRICTEMNGKFAQVDAEFARVHTRIDGLEHKMDAGFESLRGELAEHRAEQRGELAEHRAEQRGELAEHRAEQRGELAEQRGELAEHRGEIALQMARMTRTMVFIMSGFMLTIWGTMLGIGLT